MCSGVLAILVALDFCFCLLCAGAPKLDTVLLLEFHQCWTGGNNSFLWPAGYALAHAALDVAVLFLPQGHGAGSCLACPLGPAGPLLLVIFYWYLPSFTVAWRYSIPAGAYLFLNSMRLLSAHFCCMSRFFWTAALHSTISVNQSSQFVVVCSCGLSSSLKDCKPASLSIDPWGTSLIAGCWLGFISLITTPWAL